MLKSSPNPIDVQDLQFKLRCRLKVFDNTKKEPFSKNCNLVSAASRFGLIFVGSSTPNLQVLQIQDIEKYTLKEGDKSDYPRRNVPLPSKPEHVSVNCDGTILAVIVDKDNCPVVLFYDVKTFLSQSIALLKEIRLSPTPGVSVLEVNWNPAIPGIFTACKSDGSLGSYELKGTGIDCSEIPAQAGATSFCWSPKGKQISVGSRDGKITQYKPDLKAVKVINPPPLPSPHSLISLQWVSNYQFIGVYQPSNPGSQPCVIVVDAPKAGEVTFTNYDDVCYSNGSTRPSQFYMIFEQHWSVLMVASSNSMEVGVLGNSADGWTQWIMGDAARAELPLSHDHQDTLPIGFTLDTGATDPLPWGESSLPAAPILIVLSHYGILCCFNVINLKPGAPTVCSPPEKVPDLSGLNLFVTSNAGMTDPDTIKQSPQVIQSVAKPEIPTNPSLNTFSQNSNIKVPSEGTSSSIFGNLVTATTTTSQPSLFSATVFANKNVPTASPNLQTAPFFAKPQPIAATTQSIFGFTETNKTSQITTTSSNTSVLPLFGAKVQQGETLKIQPQTTQTTSFVGFQPTQPAFSFGDLTKQQDMAPSEVTTTPIKSQSEAKLEAVEINDDDTISNITSDVLDNDEMEELLGNVVKEECLALETEFKILMHRSRQIKLDVGTDAEKIILVKTSEDVSEFIKEVTSNCVSQRADVHQLKQNLIQTWAWYEEARSRYNIANDPSINILLKAQPLDSAAEKQLHQIRHLLYYLDSQLTQANAALDEQWESFQDYCKKTFKIQLPTMEAIFQSMVKHNAIMQKLSYNLKDISSRIKVKRRASSATNPLIPVNNLKKLEEHMSDLQLDSDDLCQMHCDRVLSKMKSISKTKTDKLRKLLKNKDVTPISTIKPVSILQLTPRSHKKSGTSILGAAVSPILKNKSTVSKNLFLQSTPKPKVTEGISTAASATNSKTFTIKSEIPQTTSMGLFTPKSSPLTFVSSSTVSAFAPTTQSSIFPSVATTASTITMKQNSIFSSVSVTTATSLPKTVAATANSTFTLSNFSFNQSKPQVVSTTASKFASTMVAATPKTTTPVLFTTSASAVKTTTTASSIISTFSFTNQGSIFGGLPQVNVTNAASTSSTVPTVSNNTSTSISKPAGFVNTTVTSTAKTTTKPFDLTSLQNSEISITPISKSAVTTQSTTQSLILSSLLTNTSSTAENPIIVVPTCTVSQTSTPLFGAASTTTTTSATSLFGNVHTASAKTSVFATTTTSSSVCSTPKTTVTSAVLQTADSTTKVVAPQPLNLSSNTPASATPSNQSTIFGTSSAVPAKLSFNFGTAGTSTPSLSTPTTNTKPLFDSPSSTTSSAAATTTAAPLLISTPAVATTQSIFGKATSSSSATPSVFGSNTTTTTTTASIFGAALAPTFSTSTTTPSISQSIFGSTTATTASIFNAPATSASPAFGSVSSSTTSETKSIFGAALSTQAPFGTATAASNNKSIFGTPSTNTSIQSTVFNTSSEATPTFGNSASKSESVFGISSQSTAFGVADSTNTTQTTNFGIFGSTTTPTSSQSVFGSSPVSSQSQSVFGAPTTTASVFGAPTTTASVFGAPTTTASVFGAPTTTASVFGSTFGGNAFGSSTTPSSSASSPFGQASSNVFGSPAATSANIFGQSNTFDSASSNVFGGSATFGTPASTSSFNSSSPFGVSTPGSLFSKPTTTTTSMFGSNGSVFGSAEPNNTSPFGLAPSSNNVFGAVASQPSSSFSFVQSAANNGTGTSSFGFGGLNVGSTTTNTNSAFGSGFGDSSASAQQNPFGRSVFSSTATTSTSIFGNPANTSSSSIFGGGSASNSFGNSSFGSSSGFGSASTFGQPGTFGQQSAFGSSQPGPFSGGAGSVAQSGFGSPPSFQKPSGFGSSPVFGAQASFGGAPTFGSTPTFGGGAAPKVFGSPTNTASTFDTGNQQTSTFANLANQNTIGFGNLAQQAQNQQSSTGFTGNSSFSSWR